MNDLSLEMEYEGCTTAMVLQLKPNLEAVRAAVHAELPHLRPVHLFELDHDEELTSVEGRRAIAIVATRCKKIAVTVDFNGESKTEHFAPSAKVNKVLRWATGKRGFNLDDDARAKANLIVPGTTHPVPKEAPIVRYVITNTCNAKFDLTLKDFSNGC